MYSNSNSFLGGGNSGRPGISQYSQSAFPSTTQGPQQPTSFGAGQIQQQYTGYPSQGHPQGFQPLQQQQQPQYAGFTPQSQQQFQPSLPSQSPVAPKQTGQTSSQIAQSFQTTPAATPSVPQPLTNSSKIPKIRLSFLSAQDQAKFEQLFKSAVGTEQSLDGTMTSMGIYNIG